MGLLDRQVNRGFKTTKDGNKLIFPHGVFGHGYIIPSEAEFQRLQKWVRAFIIWQVCETVIFFLIVIYVSAQIGVIFFLVFFIFNRMWLYSQYRHLEQADERFVFDENLTNRVRKIGFLSLFLIEIGAIALVGLGFFLIIVYWQHDIILLSSIGLIIFFRKWTIFIGKQLIVKIRQGNLN